MVYTERGEEEPLRGRALLESKVVDGCTLYTDSSSLASLVSGAGIVKAGQSNGSLCRISN